MRHRHKPRISLLVPFRPSVHHPHRARLWRWLRDYWRHELPEAEIVIGRSTSHAFSKTEAVNDAARRARGGIFVLLDSDAYLAGSAIMEATRQIEEAAERGHHLWFVPYRNLYRLTEESTELVLESDPSHPYRFSTPPPEDAVESTEGSMHGHHYGAMCLIMPREAFETVGCMDPRFKGWGGEDVAFLLALDTLYGKHKSLKNDILHLWHPSIGKTVTDKMWEGQHSPGVNNNLAVRYHRAHGDSVKMRILVDEGCLGCARCTSWWYYPLAWLRLVLLRVYYWIFGPLV
jgi:hypothetical protein